MAKDLKKLLGGYATGTLTERERTALFEAALDNQQLFDALADEEALRELLDDPESRSRLLGMLEQTSSRRRKGWLATAIEPFRRPFNLALAGSVVAAAVAVFVFANLMREAPVDTLGGTAADRTGDPVRLREQRALPQQRAAAEKSRALPPAPPAPRADRKAGPHRPARPPSKAPAAAGQPTPGGRMLETGESKPALRLSLIPSLPKGPARELFYRGAELQRRPVRDARPSLPQGQETKASGQQGAGTTDPAPSELARFEAPRDHPPIGLSLGLETRGANGVYVATDLQSPLETHDEARLTAEANAEAYLYAGKMQAGTWHWLFPSPGEPGAGSSAARIQPGQRISLPLRIDTSAAQAPDQSRLLIILSHRALPELEKTLPLASEREVLAGNVQDLLERHSAHNAKETPIVQQSDKRVYFVSRSTAPIIPVAIAFDVLPR